MKLATYKGWLNVLLITAMVVVVLGAYTRLSDAGLGCPDWPGCYGHLILPDDAPNNAQIQAAYQGVKVDSPKAWKEMIHRYVAGGLALLLLGLALVAHRSHEIPVTNRLMAWILVAWVSMQAMFGMWTVTWKLWPLVVTGHLMGGMGLLGLLYWSRLRLSVDARGPVGVVEFLALCMVVVQIALGGWVSSNYAALACTGFPECNGSLWPAMDWVGGFFHVAPLGDNYEGGWLGADSRVAIHMAHRIGAGITTLLVLTVVLKTFLMGRGALALWLLGVLALQVTLGILNVVSLLPLWNAVMHNAVGAILLLSVFTAAMVNRGVRDA